MKKKQPPQHYLFVGKYYPRDENGNPMSVNHIWHQLLAENSENILSKDIIGAALHSGRDSIKIDNLVKLINLCSIWSGEKVTFEDIRFTKEELEEARIESGLDPEFFVRRRVVSERQREAIALCRIIGDGGESVDWTDDLRQAAKSIAEKTLYASATHFLRKHRYAWDASKGCYIVPNEQSRISVINRNAGRDIDWLQGGAAHE